MPNPRFHPIVRLLICLVGAVIITLIVSFVIASAVMAAVYIPAVASSTRPSPDEVQKRVSDFFTTNQLLINLLIYPSVLLWLWFCRRVLDRRSFVSLGLRARRSVRDTSLGLFSGAAAVTFLFGLLWLLAVIAINGFPPLSWSGVAFTSSRVYIAGMLALYAFAFCWVGFMEEISFRGYVFHNLVAWIGIRAAMITQAVLFALVHISNVLMPKMQQTSGGVSMPTAAETWGAIWDIRWGMVNIFLIGIFFALSYIKTGSLWFPIGFHIAWNFFLGCIYSLPVSGVDIFHLLDVKSILDAQNNLITGGAFGGEGSLLLVPIIGVMVYLLNQQPDHPQALLDLGLLQPVKAAAIEQNVVTPVAEDTGTPRFSEFKTRLRHIENAPSDDLLHGITLATSERREAQTQLPQAQPAAPQVVSEPITIAPQPVIQSIPSPTPIVQSRIPELPQDAPVVTTSAQTPIVVQPQPIVTQPRVESPPPTTPPPAPTPPASKPPTNKPPAPRW